MTKKSIRSKSTTNRFKSSNTSSKMKRFLFLLFILSNFISQATYLFIPMDDSQKNHLKAYGISFYALEKSLEVDWLLNYRGGSFALKLSDNVLKECKIRGVSFEIVADVQYNKIVLDITQPAINQDVMKLEKAPTIAVYSPKNKQPWDDAVTLVMAYAEIPYEVVYDEEIINGDLSEYDWLHLHHEDFTGQYGKFWSSYEGSRRPHISIRLGPHAFHGLRPRNCP